MKEREERVALWTVSRQWRTQYLLLLAVNVILATVFVSWYETAVRDTDTLADTAIAVMKTASQVYVGIAIGTAVLLDVIIVGKTIVTSLKGVMLLLSDILKEALRKQEERQKEMARLRQENKELREELERRRNGS